jgi:DNA-binding beta-propeller fold protein YncE
VLIIGAPEVLVNTKFEINPDAVRSCFKRSLSAVSPPFWPASRYNAPVLPSLFVLLALFAPARMVVTIAGTGIAGYQGDGGLATQARIANPYGLVIGPDGALYFCEIDNHIIRRLDLATGTLTTVAGNGRRGYSGDEGPATEASLNQPYEVRFDRAGNMYFVEMQNHLIRRVDARTRRISTLAGTGTAGFGGDGGPALKAQFRSPHSITFDSSGGLLVCDIGNHRIRRIDLNTGTIETWAGTGERQPTPDGAPLRGTPLNGPRAIDSDSQGNLYLALREGNAVYRIDPKKGRIYHVAGTGEKGYSGDGGPAKSALLSGPKGIAYAPDHSLYIADTESHTVRRIDLKTGIITTVIGTGEPGDGPDGDPLRCKTARPHGVFVDRNGVLYVGDSEAHRIRMLK